MTTMFFLLRMAFWLGLVLVLLPTGKNPEAENSAHVDTSQAISAATAAVADISQFCTRQPAACVVGGQAATVIGHRAQAGARKVYEMIVDKKSDGPTGSIARRATAELLPADRAPADTLTQDDLKIEWRMPSHETPQGARAS
jgi:hypothetical protein